MTRSEISRRARMAIVRALQCPAARVTDGADFRRDLKADSLDLASLPAALEEEFGVRLSDDEAAFCQTVGTAIDLIEAKIERRRGLAA